MRGAGPRGAALAVGFDPSVEFSIRFWGLLWLQAGWGQHGAACSGF